MRALGAVVALLLACHLLGHAIARCCARSGQALAPARLTPFLELALGVCLASWLGALLAATGLFSAPRLLLLLGLAAGLVALAGRRSTVAGDPSEGARRTLAAGGVIALAVACLYLPPYDTIVTASDATIATNAGIHLARHGTFAVEDRLLGELPDAERATLFRLDEIGRWLRLEGMTLSADGHHLWPSFSHLAPVWVAATTGLGGLEARGLPGVVFAALALWAIFLFASELHGMLVAVIATALLLTNGAELFYGRFLMPEILTQFFLWSGFLAFVVWRRDGSLPAAAVSGLALGLAALTRVELLFLLPLPVALFFGLAGSHLPGTGLFLAAFAGPLLDGVVRLALVPSHYQQVVWTELQRVRGWSFFALDMQALLRDAVLLAALAAIAVILRSAARARLRRVATLAAAGAAIGAYVLRSDPHLTLLTYGWLVESVWWPIALAALVGLALWLRAPVRNDPAHGFPLVVLLVVGGLLLYDPHVGRNYLWGVRRLVPLVIPFAYLLAVTALDAAGRGLPPRARLAIVGGIGSVLLVVNVAAASRVRALHLFPDQGRPLQAVADAIPETAIVFFIPSLDDPMLHVALWLTHGKESAVLPPWLWKSALRTTAQRLRERPVFLVTDGSKPNIGDLDLIPRATVDFELRTPEPDAERAPSSAIASPVRVQLYEVRSPK